MRSHQNQNILRQNDYPEEVIISGIKKKILNFQTSKQFDPEKCPVYLKLPWIGNIFLIYEKQTKSAVNNCFESVWERIIFSLKKMLPFFQKDALPAHKRSNIVYKYLCHYDSVYVDRTSQRLKDPIRQHILKFITNQVKPQNDLPRRRCKSSQIVPISDSAISQYLLNNKICAKKFDINWF